MAKDAIEFELVSPERLVLSEAVEMVVVPGDQGDFGVLPGHAPMISSMRPGTICIFADGGVSTRIFVSGGFAEVTPERCTVLAEDAVPLDQIDRALVEQTIRDVGEDAEVATSETERAAAERRLVVVRAMLEAVAEPVYQ